MIRYTLLLLLSILILLLPTGCRRDDTSGCPSIIELKLTTQVSTDGSSEEDTFNTMSVYVFDTSGRFVDFGKLQSDNISNGQVVELAVAPGTYTLVAWCGADFDAHYEIVACTEDGGFTGQFVKGVTKLEDMRLRAKTDELSAMQVGNLFWSEIKEVTVGSGVNRVKLDTHLMKNTNRIEIMLKDAAEETSVRQATSSRYTASLTTVAGVYKFDNTSDASLACECNYAPYEEEARDGDLYLRLHTLRLFIDTPVRLTVVDRLTESIVYTADLIELIMQNPAYRTQSDLDNEDTYKIEIEGSFGHIDQVGITITVNGWEIVHLDPQS